MAEDQCTESSVAASSSPPPNWWDLQATSSNPACWHQPNPNSNSSCDEDATSFTNASNHSGLTVESSRRLHATDPAHYHTLITEAASDNHIWSQLLLGVGSNGELHGSQGVLSSKSFMYEPACDYLKQIENWELTSSPSFNGFSEGLMESKNKLSDLVGNWSIAPPNPEPNRQQPWNISLSSSMDHHHHYSPPLKQHSFTDHTASRLLNMNSGLCPSYSYSDHLKLEDDDHWEMDGAASPGARRSPFNASNCIGGDGNKGCYGIQNSPRNFADVISFSSRLGKPSLIDNIHGHKPSSKALDHCKKPTSQTRMNGGRGQGINEGKKKRQSEDNSESVVKKTKQDQNTSTEKVPKVKLADKITALQQIVSPFGKTDTASVLYEAIGYIKFLQEQVQLLSNPYMKITNSQKDPWGGMERKEKGDDLRSRGLCLVPISCTPQVYRENTGSDYWTPAYRGCLYR